MGFIYVTKIRKPTRLQSIPILVLKLGPFTRTYYITNIGATVMVVSVGMVQQHGSGEHLYIFYFFA